MSFGSFLAQIRFQFITDPNCDGGLLLAGYSHTIPFRRKWYRTVTSSIVSTVRDLSILVMTVADDSLAHRLIKARSAHGWTQAELAEVSGVAAAQISRYEAGRSKPRSEIVAKLARALAVRFDWLAYGRGEIELEDGAEVPAHPSTRSVVTLIEMTPEMIEMVEAFARERGITYQMAISVAVREMLAKARADPEAFVARMKAGEKK